MTKSRGLTFAALFTMAFACQVVGGGAKKGKGGELPKADSCSAEGLQANPSETFKLIEGQPKSIDFKLCTEGQLISDWKELDGAEFSTAVEGQSCQNISVAVKELNVSLSTSSTSSGTCRLLSTLKWKEQVYTHTLEFSASQGTIIPEDITSSLSVNVQAVEGDKSKIRVTFRAKNPAARIFETDHAQHARFEAMLQKSKEKGIRWVPEPSFDPETRTYTVIRN